MSYMPNVIAFRPRTVSEPLRRPSILIRAAREGQAGWRRDRDLKRLLRLDHTPAAGNALPRLRAEIETHSDRLMAEAGLVLPEPGDADDAARNRSHLRS